MVNHWLCRHLHASSDLYLTAMPINVVALKGLDKWVAKSVSADPLSLTDEGQPGGHCCPNRPVRWVGIVYSARPWLTPSYIRI